MTTRTVRLPSSEATLAAGERLGAALRGGEKILLVGPLGAGKTTFTQGVAKGFGVSQEVTSPTFTIIHEHRGARGCLWHVDLYRIDDPRELPETGFDELWEGPDVVLVEWGDRLPASQRRRAAAVVTLRIEGEGRRLSIAARRRAMLG